MTCVLQLWVYFSLLFLGLLSAVSASAALAKLQAVCTRTSQRNSVNNVLKKPYLNTKWYLRVSGSLWLLCVIGSKFKTASVFLPYLLDLNSVISLVTSSFRTACSDPDVNVSGSCEGTIILLYFCFSCFSVCANNRCYPKCDTLFLVDFFNTEMLDLLLPCTDISIFMCFLLLTTSSQAFLMCSSCLFY